MWIDLKKKKSRRRDQLQKFWYDWYNWLINFILEPIRKNMGGVNDQIMSLFKTQAYSKPKRVKTVNGSGKKPSKLRIQKQYENIFSFCCSI